MRYWYLKGGDVLGPLSAQEIAKDSDFSAEILVCPEPNSGDETFWKTPSMYAGDFGPYIKEEAPVKTTPAPKETRISPVIIPAKAEVAIPSAAPAKETLHSAEYADLAAVSPEETIHSQSPLNAALENNLLEDLPAKAVLAQEEPKEEKKEEPKAEVKKEEKKAEEKPHPADPLIAVIENQKPLQSFREEDFTLVSPAKAVAQPTVTPKESDKEGTIFRQKQEHAAPVIIKPAGIVPLQKTKAPSVKQEVPAEPAPEPSAKIPLPVETFSAGSGVIHIKEEGEEIPAPHEALTDKTASREKSFFSAMSEEKPIIHTGEETDAPFPFGGEMKTAEVSELIKEEPTGPFLQVKQQKPRPSPKIEEEEEEPLIPASAGDRVPGGIMPTTNGKIISSSDGRLEDKKPKNDVIYLLVISMCLFTGIALFMTFFGNKKEDKKTSASTNAAHTQKESSSSPVLQGVDEGIASPEAQRTAPVKTSDIANEKGAVVQQDAESSKIKAQEIVKKYLLDEARGTIADFLNKTYGGGDYQMSWSSSPLYADTYVVDFTASKVRAEPIVYLFRVDIKKGAVTGGLNGITMDLLADK